MSISTMRQLLGMFSIVLLCFGIEITGLSLCNIGFLIVISSKILV